MNTLCQKLRLIGLFALLMVLAGPAIAGYPPHVPILQPYQAVSPNGSYLLEVKPSHRYGSGPSVVTLTLTGSKECAWKCELPFTFWQACVNDQGTVGGFAYSKGPMGGAPYNMGEDDAGNLIVRIIDVKGTTIYEETSRRGPIFGGYTSYSPPLSPKQLLFNPSNNRMILRLGEVFRSYNLREGCLDSAVVPIVEDIPARLIYCEEARLIPKSPLLLVQWEYQRAESRIEGTVFGVIDEQGKLLWSVSHENKIREEGNITYVGNVRRNILAVAEMPAEDPPDNVPADPPDTDPFAEPNPGAKPPEPAPPEPHAQFDLYVGDTGERVTYQVMKIESADEISWSVKEAKRAKWELMDEDEEVPPKDIPLVESANRGDFQLRGPDHKPLEGIAAVALGPDERIYALDRKSGGVCVFDRGGKLLHVCQPPKEEQLEIDGNASLAVNDRGEVFVKIDPTTKSKGKSNPDGGSFLRFSPEGVAAKEPLPPVCNGSDETWIAQPKSTCLIVEDYKTIRLVDMRSNMAQVALIELRPDGQWLDVNLDIAFAPDGSIALRDSTNYTGAGLAGFPQPFRLPPNHLPAETIALYKPDGSPVRTVDFTRAAGLSRIGYDGNQIVATGEFDSPHPFVYVFKATGETIGAIRIDALAEAKELDLKPFITDRGKTILIMDCHSGRGFRYAMPK